MKSEVLYSHDFPRFAKGELPLDTCPACGDWGYYSTDTFVGQPIAMCSLCVSNNSFTEAIPDRAKPCLTLYMALMFGRVVRLPDWYVFGK